MARRITAKSRVQSGQLLAGFVTFVVAALVIGGTGIGMLLSSGPKAARNQRIDDGSATGADYQSAQDDGNKLKRTIEVGAGGAGFIGEGGPIGPGGAVGPDFHGPIGDAAQVVKNFTDDATQTAALAPTITTTPTATPSCPPTPPPSCPPACSPNNVYQQSLTGTGTAAGGFSVTGSVTSTTPPAPTPTKTVPSCP